jgi:uncharacterized membrane protein
MHWDSMRDWWWVMVIAMTVFWAVVVWAIVMLVRDRDGSRIGDRPDDALKLRLARGEITPEEYERSRKLLRG